MPATIQEIETILGEVIRKGWIDPQRETLIQEFLEDYERQARELYDKAIAVSSKMYNRQQIVGFWFEQFQICQAQLHYLNRLDRFLCEVHSDLDITGVIKGFEALLDAIRRHYEFHGQAPIFHQVLPLPTLPRMNALTGAGSIFALFGNYYDHHDWTDAPQADALAISYDWVVTGNDIRAAIGQFKKEFDARQPELF